MLGTVVEITVLQEFEHLIQKCFDECLRIDKEYSRFRDNNELSKLNAKLNVWQEVSSELFFLLEFAQKMNKETKGVFDISVKKILENWGYDKEYSRKKKEQISELGSYELDSKLNKVKLTAEVELGAFGKGYAIDQAVKLMTDNGVFDFVIHGGQSSVSARGADMKSMNQTTSTNDGWTVGLSHPLIPEQRLAEIVLRNESLGTSGTGRQGFFHEGKRFGHIINPLTGWPTDHILSSTVITNNAAKSDALATAFFVMDVSDVEEYCRRNTDVKTILIAPTSKSTAIEMISFNMDESDWSRC